MAPPQTRILGLALALAATATVWFLATKKDATPESIPQPAEVVRDERVASPAVAQPVAASLELEESLSTARRSAEDQAGAVKRMLTLAMGTARDQMIDALVAQGLSQTDAAQIARRANEGVAECIYDAARGQYEAQGDLNEFLDHADIDWIVAALNLNRVRAAMAPCLGNIGQQAGISWPAHIALGGNLDERIRLPGPAPPWAAEMESRIRQHVALHPGLGVTDVIVKCREEGCSAMLIGSDIRIFEFDFDSFAEQNGFQEAVVGGDKNLRSVSLRR